ncbi:MAG: DUF2779 domain-containing protein [Dehalococcoidia bacterium]|nr:DUF2779 domain-containing protein [Dehalococcoidia bacterium]
MPWKFDSSVMNKAALTTGTAVGKIARDYFGGYSKIAFSRNKERMAEATRCLLDNGTAVITEAAFLYNNNFCISDILRKVLGGYELIEVKASSFSADDGISKIKPIYLYDMAFQTHIITDYGIDLKKVSIMQINRDYVRQGNLDIRELFVLTDFTDQVFGMQKGMSDSIAEIKSVAAQEEEPDIVIGSRCDDPYECGYKNWCFRNLPPNSVFDIGWSMRDSKKDEAYYAGIVTFEDVLNCNLNLNEKQLRQVTVAVQNLPPQINKESIRDFLSTISYPLYHLDFETFQQAIPLWDGVSPYKQIPFQYSLHIQDGICGKTSHKEFLAKEGLDPRRQLAERLCADIPLNACVMVYNKSFEKGRINELAKLFPDLSEHLMSINDGMIDLAVPFQSGDYYCQEMGGSYSIKSVLPALCPDDPELNYNALSLIHNGSEAMETYATLHEQPPEAIAEIRVALLAYCHLDTLAMVKVLERLYTITR